MAAKRNLELLVGDNPFHGISHLSQERSRSRTYSLGNSEYAADLKRIKNRKTWLKRRIFDFDCDGFDEILLENAIMNLYISPGYGGSIFEIDLKGDKYVNLVNTIS